MMKSPELEHVYEIDVEVSQLNENGHLKPYAYQFLIADIAGRHLNRFHINADDTSKYGLSWALISQHVEVIRPVVGCEKLYAQTWHTAIKGPYFRRDLIFRDKNGEVVFMGVTFSILLDLEKRSVARPKVLDSLPLYLPEANPEFLFEAKPTRKFQMEHASCDTRKVQNSYLDLLGHVNNCRYSEFAYDAFTKEEVLRLGQLKHMEIYFESELRPGDTFTIGKAYERNTMFFCGHNNDKNDTSFDIVMTFEGDEF